jgi:hypothetical protein
MRSHCSFELSEYSLALAHDLGHKDRLQQRFRGVVIRLWLAKNGRQPTPLLSLSAAIRAPSGISVSSLHPSMPHALIPKTAFALQVIRCIRLRVFVERCPTTLAIRPAAGLTVNGVMPFHDRFHDRKAAVMGPYRDERSAPADSFGVDMGVVFADAGGGQGPNQSPGHGTGACAGHSTNGGRRQPSGGYYGPQARNGE